MDDFAILGGLFAIAFVAATILPAQSEAALVGLLVAGAHSPLLLVAVASLGNVLGATVNWALGRGVERFRDAKWFPVRPAALDRATGWYRRWGPVEPAFKLGADRRRRADRRGRRAARAFVELPAPRHNRQGGSLHRARRGHVEPGVMLAWNAIVVG